MEIIYAAWDGNADSLRCEVITGVCEFIRLYHDRYNSLTLVKVLEQIAPRELCCFMLSDFEHKGYKRFVHPIFELYNACCGPCKDAGINSPVTANLCRDGSGWNPVKPTDNLNGKVLVIRPEVLKYEYRRMTHQLVYCNGGFGAEPCARGSAVYCTNIYSGQKSRYERGDILAIVDPAALEEEAEWSPWIKEGLKRIEEKSHKDKGSEAR